MPSAPPLLLQETLQDALAGAPLDVAVRRWASGAPHAWNVWLLLCLLRQIPRQRWLARVVRERLGTAALDHGNVPGMPGWRFADHGLECCLESPDGELVDVDLAQDSGLTVDATFFTRSLFSTPAPALPEARLTALLRTEALVVAALEELRGEGLIRTGSLHHVFRLSPALEDLAAPAAQVDFLDPAQGRRWALFAGDYEWLARLQPEEPAWHVEAQRARAARRSWLEGLLAAEHAAPVALRPLEDLLDGPEFLALCTRLLQGPATAATCEAIRRLDARPELPPCPAVRALLDRWTAGRDPPAALPAAAAYLLRRDLDRDAVVERVMALARSGAAVEGVAGEVALLALEHAPEQAGELVRRALRGPVPGERLAVAAVLALLDRPWCRRALTEALQSHAARVDGVEIVAALRRSRFAGARQGAERWLQAHPRTERTGVGYSWEQVANANVDAFLEQEMAARRAWAERVGPRLPDIL